MKKFARIQVLIQTSNKDDFRNNIVTIEIPEEAANIIAKSWEEENSMHECVFASALASNQEATCVLRVNNNTLASVSPMDKIRSIEDVFNWHDIEPKNETYAEYSVPKNDYVQPKYIRKDVVQSIIKSMLWYIDNRIDFIVKDNNNGLYVTHKGFISDKKDSSATRVNGAEMNAAFAAISEAGYFLYKYHDTQECKHIYFWSKKPMNGSHKPTKDVSFDVFID